MGAATAGAGEDRGTGRAARVTGRAGAGTGCLLAPKKAMDRDGEKESLTRRNADRIRSAFALLKNRFSRCPCPSVALQSWAKRCRPPRSSVFVTETLRHLQR